MKLVIDLDKDEYKNVLTMVTAAYIARNGEVADQESEKEEKPVKTKTKTKTKTKAKPEKEKPAEEVAITFDDMVKYVSDINEKHDFSTALALIKKHGAAKLSDIKPGGYAAFAADAEKILSK